MQDNSPDPQMVMPETVQILGGRWDGAELIVASPLQLEFGAPAAALDREYLPEDRTRYAESHVARFYRMVPESKVVIPMNPPVIHHP